MKHTLTLATLLFAVLSWSVIATAEVASGVVYEDVNRNGIPDMSEPRMEGIRVSNGEQIVKTNWEGRYELPVDDDTSIFVIKPRGYRTPLSQQNLPQFYYTHKPQGSPASRFAGVAPTGELPKSIDFPLYRQPEPRQFKAILFGDPQPRDQQEVDYIAHDVVKELIGTDASFGVTLGDIAFDNLDVFEAQANVIATIGIPWYNVIGNHDLNLDASDDQHSDESFERVFGPNYYSFDYGPVHFLVLDDVEWYVPDGSNGGKYRGGFDQQQMAFIRRDLELIPPDQLVVIMMHIPLTDVENRSELFRLIERRPFCISISAHTHMHEHRFITKDDGWQGPQPHHHIINVTVSGSWWSGAPNEQGIPSTPMRDGAPNGYSILTFDGRNYELRFKAAGYPADYQMEIFLAAQSGRPERLAGKDGQLGKQGQTVGFVKTDVGDEADQDDRPLTAWVNVFNGSERSTATMRVDDSARWILMERTVQPDPRLAELLATQQKIADQVGSDDLTQPWRRIGEPKPSTHLWCAQLPENLSPGTHVLHVRTTDMFGKTYAAQRLFRIEE